MKENIVLAVAGATGAVGECILDLLFERRFPAASVHALASARSVDRSVSFGSGMLDVQNLADVPVTPGPNEFVAPGLLHPSWFYRPIVHS